jgi:hypothetical protein
VTKIGAWVPSGGGVGGRRRGGRARLEVRAQGSGAT